MQTKCIASLILVLDGCGHGQSGAPPDAGDAVVQTIPSSAVSYYGGTVDRLRFGVFGDVRPANRNDVNGYPSAVVAEILSNLDSLGAQFVVATGDYMFASTLDEATAQVGELLQVEQGFGGVVFHAMGNHECNGDTVGNCPNESETPNVGVFRSQLAGAYAHVYFDWVIGTAGGDAHFIATAPNAWSVMQSQWLANALAQPAAYTFVLAHEPPTSSSRAPGSAGIEAAIAMRVPGVTLRLYGHTHEYDHLGGNGVISGNGGAPLDGTNQSFGFLLVAQRDDGNIGVTAYSVGEPPNATDQWVVAADGTLVE